MQPIKCANPLGIWFISTIVFIALFLQFTFASEVQNNSQGLVAVWHFDENVADGNIYDSSPEKIPARCFDANCPTFVEESGKYGGAYYYNGINNYFVIPNKLGLNSRQAITISFWINADDWNKNTKIIQKGSQDNQYRFYSENGLLKFDLKGILEGTVASELPQKGVWQHIAGTYNGETVKLFVGGLLVSQQNSVGLISTSAEPLFIGTKNYASPSWDRFNGTIDELAIWNRALSDDELLELSEANTTAICGDSVCANSESCGSCSEDCGVCKYEGCYDTNNDKEINILDVAYVATMMGTSNSWADLNEDQIVDIADIVLAISAIGKNCG